MKVSLVPNWKKVVTKAWSIWLILLAALLTGLEVSLPYLPIEVASGRFAVASLCVSACAYVARLVAQKELHDVSAEDVQDSPS